MDQSQRNRELQKKRTILYFIQAAEELIEEKGQDEEIVVCDYIAGMSDQYSVAKFLQIYEPGFWKMW